MSRAIHQVIQGTGAADAMTSQALTYRNWIRSWGFNSELFAFHIGEGTDPTVRPFAEWHPAPNSVTLYQHGFDFPELIQRMGRVSNAKLAVVYQNVTPPRFFSQIDPALGRALTAGREQLRDLQRFVSAAGAASHTNRVDLEAAGYSDVIIIPITMASEMAQVEPDPAVLNHLKSSTTNLLFVGRFTPNKRQEDLLPCLAYLKRLRPDAKLHLVGEQWHRGYNRFIETEIERYRLHDSVEAPGRVSWEALAAYYTGASVYISMSEHEGFGKPYLESMSAGLPILAYDEPGTAETLGPSGIRFSHKRFDQIAECIDLVLTETDFRERLIATQRAQLPRFSDAVGQAALAQLLKKAGVEDLP